jgi:2-polyprenyl-3-methyl-5-hydroxy-6-metoxy-1,4-benzoquinol methylase
MLDENKNCLLCGELSLKKTNLLWECLTCGLLFKDPETFMALSEEKSRYLTHNNDVNDSGYLSYLERLFELVSDRKGKVLDFGCGPTQGLKALVEKRNYQSFEVDSYDPIFFPELNLKKKYDIVFASECVEHAYHPAKTFELLKKLIKKEGVLALSTAMSDGQNLETWWYKNDPSHVVFFSEKTIKHISTVYHFEIILFKSPHVLLKSR